MRQNKKMTIKFNLSQQLGFHQSIVSLTYFYPHNGDILEKVMLNGGLLTYVSLRNCLVTG